MDIKLLQVIARSRFISDYDVLVKWSDVDRIYVHIPDHEAFFNDNPHVRDVLAHDERGLVLNVTPGAITNATKGDVYFTFDLRCKGVPYTVKLNYLMVSRIYDPKKDYTFITNTVILTTSTDGHHGMAIATVPHALDEVETPSKKPSHLTVVK